MACDRVASLRFISDAHWRFAQMLAGLGCRVVGVEDLKKPKVYLAILCEDHEAGDRHTAEIIAALLRSDRKFRRELRLGRWRGRLLPSGNQVLFWEGAEFHAVH